MLKQGARRTCADVRLGVMPPPRLFVIMAREAPVAVVVRRGPAAWAQITLWDTESDAFTRGAWFRGRIYENKCDVSPDGQLFVYAAFQGRKLRTSYSDSWTAVSRPPWLHALALWPMGTTYGGGGRFVDDRRLVLRGASGAHPDHPPQGLEIVPGEAEYHRSTGEVEGAEWSGRDQRNRLVFASGGRIWARRGGKGAGAADVELADFNADRPDPQPAPEWATCPLLVSARNRSGRGKKQKK